MEATNREYWETIQKTEEQLLPFLRILEAMQEEILIGREREAQERVRAIGENLFPTLTEEVAKLSTTRTRARIPGQVRPGRLLLWRRVYCVAQRIWSQFCRVVSPQSAKLVSRIIPLV